MADHTRERCLRQAEREFRELKACGCAPLEAEDQLVPFRTLAIHPHRHKQPAIGLAAINEGVKIGGAVRDRQQAKTEQSVLFLQEGPAIIPPEGGSQLSAASAPAMPMLAQSPTSHAAYAILASGGTCPSAAIRVCWGKGLSSDESDPGERSGTCPPHGAFLPFQTATGYARAGKRQSARGTVGLTGEAGGARAEQRSIRRRKLDAYVNAS